MVERSRGVGSEGQRRRSTSRGASGAGELPGRAITAAHTFGQGFLSSPGNDALRGKLERGELYPAGLLEQLRVLLYRLLFCAAAEARGLLPVPAATEQVRAAYHGQPSFGRLIELSLGAGEPLRPSEEGKLWAGLCCLFARLGGHAPGAVRGVPVLGSFLWAAAAMPDLAGCTLDDESLLAAVGALAAGSLAAAVPAAVAGPGAGAGTGGGAGFAALGSAELGAVHEALLELHVELGRSGSAWTFALHKTSGHQRKTYGSYSTPPLLVECLLDTALDPLLDEVVRSSDGERALLRLKVCDPACGTGPFLVAAARRIAMRLAIMRSGLAALPPLVVKAALAEVVGRCLYGVDRHPLAVELCKVSLWLEAGQPEWPLTIFDWRIRCGNSLLGATPALLAGGIPDEAFEPLAGDDHELCRRLRRNNRSQRESGQRSLFDLVGASPRPPHDVAVASATAAPAEQQQQLAADGWCAAFVAPRSAGGSAAPAITEETYRRLARGPDGLPPALVEAVHGLAAQHGFFHWHLAFPEVFAVDGAAADIEADGSREGCPGWTGGFDVVLANPPWERIKLQEKEWFASRRPEVALAPHKARREQLIARLAEEAPALHEQLARLRDQAERESHLLRQGGRYPLCGRGDLNTYALFAECCRQIVHPAGLVGLIVPSGIATDDTTRFFFQDLLGRGLLHRLYDFENRARLFPGVDGRMKFALLTMAGSERPAAAGAELVCFAHHPADLQDEKRHFSLLPEELDLVHPNTRTCPMFRSRGDARLVLELHRRIPVLWREGPPEQNHWGIRLGAMFHMAGDSQLFATRQELVAKGWMLQGNVFVQDGRAFLPLYEAKMTQQFDHRAAGVVLSREAIHRQGQPRALGQAEHEDPSCLPLPRYWVDAQEVRARVGTGSSSGALLGFTDVTGPTNERTMLATLLPVAGVGHTMPLAYGRSARELLLLLCTWNSFVFDYIARQKIGGIHFTLFLLKQMPVPDPQLFDLPCPWEQGVTIGDWVIGRGLELCYTAWDLALFARSLGCSAPPFRWDAARRFQLRSELDAAFFHLYGVTLDQAEHILESFPIVKRKDCKKYGEFRTKKTILGLLEELRERGGT